MPRYSEEQKTAAMEKMMPPYSTSIPKLAEETGISDATLYNWRKQARLEGFAVPADGKNSEQWSSAAKFAVVLETASMNEAQLGEYCREQGRYSEQIAVWCQACLQANTVEAAQSQAAALVDETVTPGARRHKGVRCGESVYGPISAGLGAVTLSRLGERRRNGRP